MTAVPASTMRTERFDVVIIGTGAGGGTVAHELAGTNASVLLVGNSLPGAFVRLRGPCPEKPVP